MTQAKLKRRRGYSRLSGKRQITLPLTVVEALGWAPGDALRVEAAAGRVIVSPEVGPAERRRRGIRQVAGALTGVYEPGYLDRLRDEWR